MYQPNSKDDGDENSVIQILKELSLGQAISWLRAYAQHILLMCRLQRRWLALTKSIWMCVNNAGSIQGLICYSSRTDYLPFSPPSWLDSRLLYYISGHVFTESQP